MTRIRWYHLPIALVVLGVLVIGGTAYGARGVLGRLQWVFYCGGAACLVGVFFFRRILSVEELEHTHRQQELEEKEKRLQVDQLHLETARMAMTAEISRRSQVVQQREAGLLQKLMTFHEWMEFPGGLSVEESTVGSERFESERFEKDQAVMDLIRRRTEQLFKDIKNKVYQKDGHFEKGRLTLDMLNLMESVARIYQPDSENPLLETNVELLLRAVNRIALQMLVVLEQLPIDVKSYNIHNIYDNVQTGLRVYGVYKAANPYWNFLRPVYYLGRFGFGGNPVALGVTWALGELAKTGARKISSHITERYAMSLLYDMVFIVGSEAAGIFGGDFRYRESNWVFGAELTDLMRRFPLTEDTLLQGLNEIGRLRLRNEYDRIFFYRCLAARKSADPKRIDARACLSETERMAIGERLKKFYHRYISSTSPRKTRHWKTEVESRLGIDIEIEKS